jgi:hypothetical protein
VRFKFRDGMMVSEWLSLRFAQNGVVNQDEGVASMQRYREPVDPGVRKGRASEFFKLS